MKLKILKNLFIYFLLFTPISLGVISCSGNNKSSSKFKEEITSDFIPPITAVAALVNFLLRERLDLSLIHI